MKNCLSVISALLLLGGCLGNKASHQNGVVLYVSTSGQIGVGYGETEDLPGGCVYLREVISTSPAFWGSGTNYTRALTYWDTRWLGATNMPPKEIAIPLRLGCGKEGCRCIGCTCSPDSCPCASSNGVGTCGCPAVYGETSPPSF